MISKEDYQKKLTEFTERYNRETNNWARAVILMETTKYEIDAQTEMLCVESANHVKYGVYKWSDLTEDDDYRGWTSYFHETLKEEYEQGGFVKYLFETGRLRSDSSHGQIGHPDLYSFYYNISSTLHAVKPEKYDAIKTPTDYADYVFSKIDAPLEESDRLRKNMLNSISNSMLHSMQKGFQENQDDRLRFERKRGQLVSNGVVTMRGLILFKAMRQFDARQMGDASDDIEDMLTDLVGQMREKDVFRSNKQRNGVSYPAFRKWLGDTFGLHLSEKEFVEKMEDWQLKSGIKNTVSGKTIEKTLNKAYKKNVSDLWEHITSCMYMRLMIKNNPEVYRRISAFVVDYNVVKNAEIKIAKLILEAIDSKPKYMDDKDWESLRNAKELIMKTLEQI